MAHMFWPLGRVVKFIHQIWSVLSLREHSYQCHSHRPILLEALQKFHNSCHSISSVKTVFTTGFSIEVTSTKQPLGSSFPMARDRDASPPNATEVNGNSAYRVVRITKNFTALGVQLAAQPLQACIISQNLERPKGQMQKVRRFHQHLPTRHTLSSDRESLICFAIRLRMRIII